MLDSKNFKPWRRFFPSFGASTVDHSRRTALAESNNHQIILDIHYLAQLPAKGFQTSSIHLYSKYGVLQMFAATLQYPIDFVPPFGASNVVTDQMPVLFFSHFSLVPPAAKSASYGSGWIPRSLPVRSGQSKESALHKFFHSSWRRVRFHYRNRIFAKSPGWPLHSFSRSRASSSMVLE